MIKLHRKKRSERNERRPGRHKKRRFRNEPDRCVSRRSVQEHIHSGVCATSKVKRKAGSKLLGASSLQVRLPD